MKTDFLNCTLMRMWGIARTLIFRQYYCLRGFLGIGRYLEAVRRKILIDIRRFLIILTINKKNINAQWNKFFFHPSKTSSSYWYALDPKCRRKNALTNALCHERWCKHGTAYQMHWCLLLSYYSVRLLRVYLFSQYSS